jgi:hypothetical protein
MCAGLKFNPNRPNYQNPQMFMENIINCRFFDNLSIPQVLEQATAQEGHICQHEQALKREKACVQALSAELRKICIFESTVPLSRSPQKTSIHESAEPPSKQNTFCRQVQTSSIQACETLAVMYLQRGPPIAENKLTTHRTHRTHRSLFGFPQA